MTKNALTGISFRINCAKSEWIQDMLMVNNLITCLFLKEILCLAL